jgi:hypothetical protein
MIHRLKEQKAIESMEFWREIGCAKGSRRKLTLTEYVLKELWIEIMEQRQAMLPQNERGYTEGTVQRYTPTRRGEEVSIPKYDGGKRWAN